MANELKRKLDQVSSDLRELRERKAEASRAREEAKDQYAEALASGDKDAENKAHAAAMEAQREFGTVDEEINALQPMELELVQLAGDNESEKRANGKKPQGQPGGPMGGWSSAEMFASDEHRKQLEFIATSQSRFGSLDLGAVANRDTVVSDITGSTPVMAADIDVTPRMREGAYRGIRPAIYRPFSFLQLIPVGTTDGNLVPYTQENPVTGAALEVAEGGVKPEAGLTFTDADAPVRTIAAWMKTRKQVLSDFAALRSTIDTRLRYLVQKRLEEQVLAGDGSGVNLRGLLNTSGIGSVAWNANVPLTEQILSGITNIYLNDGAADGIALHPVDWQKCLTEKAHFGGGAGAAGTAGSYEFVGGGPFGTTPATIWGVRAVPTPVLTPGICLVADFSLGSQLLIREGVNVLFSDSDQDDFIRNRVTMLAEMRAALIVWRPSLFQSVDLLA